MSQLENEDSCLEKEEFSDIQIFKVSNSNTQLKLFDSQEDDDYNEQNFREEESLCYEIPEQFLDQTPQNIQEQATTVKRQRIPKLEKKKAKEPKIKKVIVKKESKTSIVNPSKNFPSFFIRYMVKLAEKSLYLLQLISGYGWLKEKYPKLGKVVSRKNHSISDLNCFLMIQELRQKFIESLETNDMLFYILDSNKLLSIKAYIDVLSIYYQQAKTDGMIMNQTRCLK